ncbi:MAG: hypothetical protein HY955_07805 [Deltaproteobacteria bacterium]|nr:hypothetical protein [Deltaproteobacteria bacterium]
MATVDLTVLPCGEHIKIDVTISGVAHTIITTKTAMMDPKADTYLSEHPADIVLHNLKVFCRLSGSSDWTAMKSVLKTKEFKI